MGQIERNRQSQHKNQRYQILVKIPLKIFVNKFSAKVAKWSSCPEQDIAKDAIGNSSRQLTKFSCSEEMDHHCTILGLCIGRHNLPAFISWIMYIWINIYISFFLLIDELIEHIFEAKPKGLPFGVYLTQMMLIFVGLGVSCFFGSTYLWLWSNDVSMFEYLTSDEVSFLR